MKILLSILVLLTLPGCASLDGTLCVLATDQEAEIAATLVLAEFPEGKDKSRVARALQFADLTAELRCEVARAARQIKP